MSVVQNFQLYKGYHILFRITGSLLWQPSCDLRLVGIKKTCQFKFCTFNINSENKLLVNNGKSWTNPKRIAWQTRKIGKQEMLSNHSQNPNSLWLFCKGTYEPRISQIRSHQSKQPVSLVYNVLGWFFLHSMNLMKIESIQHSNHCTLLFVYFYWFTKNINRHKAFDCLQV